MVSYSKVFDHEARYLQCSELVHSNGCIKNAILNIFGLVISNSKYNIPFILFPLLAKIHKINRKRLKNALFQYFENVTCTTMTGWVIVTCVCIVRQLTGQFRRYQSFYIPSFIGGCGTLLFSERIKQFFRYGIIQCDIETHILQRKNCITKLIANSKVVQTLLFMCSSALILHGKQQRFYRNFWLANPPAKMSTKGSPTCEHEEKYCGIYFLKGLSTYLVIGLVFDIIKAFTGRSEIAKGSGFLVKVFTKLRNLNMNSTAFMCSYISTYRLFHCYFNHLMPKTLISNHFLAAFLCGACYVLQPKLIILSFGITCATDVLWKLLKKCKISQKNQILNFIVNRLPLSNIIYVAALCHLVESYVLVNHQTSKVGTALCGGITNYAGEKIQKKIKLYTDL